MVMSIHEFAEFLRDCEKKGLALSSTAIGRDWLADFMFDNRWAVKFQGVNSTDYIETYHIREDN